MAAAFQQSEGGVRSVLQETLDLIRKLQECRAVFVQQQEEEQARLLVCRFRILKARSSDDMQLFKQLDAERVQHITNIRSIAQEIAHVTDDIAVADMNNERIIGEWQGQLDEEVALCLQAEEDRLTDARRLQVEEDERMARELQAGGAPEGARLVEVPWDV